MSREAPSSPATLKRSRVTFGPLLAAFSATEPLSICASPTRAICSEPALSESERSMSPIIFAAARLGSASTSSESLARSTIEAACLAAGRTCEGERAGQRRAIQRQLEIASGEPGRRRFDRARERGAAISERFADRRDLGHGLRRAEARPVAKQREVGAAEINVAAELRPLRRSPDRLPPAIRLCPGRPRLKRRCSGAPGAVVSATLASGSVCAPRMIGSAETWASIAIRLCRP